MIWGLYAIGPIAFKWYLKLCNCQRTDYIEESLKYKVIIDWLKAENILVWPKFSLRILWCFQLILKTFKNETLILFVYYLKSQIIKSGDIRF